MAFRLSIVRVSVTLETYQLTGVMVSAGELIEVIIIV